MSLVAAFLWNKSPRCNVSTMVFDEETMEIIAAPKIEYYAKGFFRFRLQAKTTVKKFFNDLNQIQNLRKKPIRLEFRIVFNAINIPYLSPAKESEYISKIFFYYLKKTKIKNNAFTITPQLRSKLSGRPLIKFKKELRSLYLVSRKRNTGYEYHLWTIALHATTATYQRKLDSIREKLMENYWNTPF